MMTRRRAIALLVLAAAGAATGTARRGFAGSPPTEPGPQGTTYGAQQATGGPPRIPTTFRLRLPDGSFCNTTMEEYLRGVVPSEMPALWHPEAVKAQAVAARTYAATYVAVYGYICTTTQCQFWNPANRHAASDAAIDATRGELMTYQGGMIWAYFSAHCGGQTTTSPDLAAPYCQAIRCWREPDGSGRTALDLSSEAAAYNFWAGATPPSAFCNFASNTSFRFTWTTPRSEQQAIIRTTYPSLGDLQDIGPTARNLSGGITNLRIVGTGGTFNVTGDSSIRSMLRSTVGGSSQRSVYVGVALDRDATGIVGVTGRGGRFGHGYGFCQWGARGMADRGYDYQTILRHYYSNIELVRVNPSVSAQAIPSRRIVLPLLDMKSATGPTCG